MKRLQGLVAATLITLVVGFGMVAVGVNAASNTDSVPVSNSPVQASLASASTAPDPAQAQVQAQINQLQDLIKQYQSREQQYQAELSKLSQQLSDANTQVNQLQQVLMALQERGVIQITRDGRIFIAGR
jgi:peptidoglycan hydrolase CwlO-like protein